MSFRAAELVWTRTRATGIRKLLLLAIARYAGDSGAGAWPSAQVLARDLGKTDRQVRNLLHALERAGELTIELNEARRLPAGATYAPPWFLGIRCVVAGDAYAGPAAEAPPVENSATAFRAGRPPGRETGNFGPGNRKFSTAHKRKDPVKGSGQLEDRAATASPPLPLLMPVENPKDNLRVIARLCHDVLDLFDGRPPEFAELVEAVKCRCAALHIAYNSEAVKKGLESAQFQRTRRRASC